MVNTVKRMPQFLISVLPGTAVCIVLTLIAVGAQILEERAFEHPYIEALVIAILLGIAVLIGAALNAATMKLWPVQEYSPAHERAKAVITDGVTRTKAILNERSGPIPIRRPIAGPDEVDEIAEGDGPDEASAARASGAVGDGPDGANDRAPSEDRVEEPVDERARRADGPDTPGPRLDSAASIG